MRAPSNILADRLLDASLYRSVLEHLLSVHTLHILDPPFVTKAPFRIIALSVPLLTIVKISAL
jgi:hypothetical protein